MFTQEQILEIKQRLRETGAKDTEFPLASLPLEGDEIITVVQGGENKKFPIDLFFESFSQYIDGSERVDFFNVSRYVQITQGYPEVARLTLLEAVESCPKDVRRPGQVITFMGNDDDWVIWQFNGEKKEQWLDTNYWKPAGGGEQGPQGPRGEQGEHGIDGINGKDGKDAIDPQVKLSEDGMDILVSYDNGETWYKLVPDFNKLRVLGYINSVEQLPKNANLGDIYGVWNQQAQSGQGAYEMYINTVTDWDLKSTITKVYSYDTELPSIAKDGAVAIVPVRGLTLDKEKVDGYKVYKFSLANNGWVMILNTAEIYNSKEDIVNKGDNVYALVQGSGYVTETKLKEETTVSKKDYCRISNMTDQSLMLIITQDSKRMFHSIGTGTYMVPNNCGVFLVNNQDLSDVVIAASMSDSAPKELSSLEYMPEGIYPYYILTDSSAGDIYITPQSKLDPEHEEEQEGLTVETRITTLLSFSQTYELYKRVVGWVFFGTNASITHHLIQDVNEGTATNVPSGKAVKDALDTVNANLNDFKQEVKDTYGDYTENPEFVCAVTDNKNRILYGVQKDGNFYFGVGCPQQVKDYIQQKINTIMGVGDVTEKIDTINEMIAFFNKISHDENLKQLLDAKVDKEEGKSLINAEYAEGVSQVENSEFTEIHTDADDKILYGVKKSGEFYFGAGVPQQIINYALANKNDLSADILAEKVRAMASEGALDDSKVNKVSGKALIQKEVADNLSFGDSPEWTELTLSNDEHIIEGIDRFGIKHTYLNNKFHGNILAKTLLAKTLSIGDNKTYIENSGEFVKVLLSKDEKVIGGILKNGEQIIYIPTRFALLILNDGTKISNIEDIENAVSTLTVGNSNFDNISLVRHIKSKNINICPITKVSAVYDNEGKNLQSLLDIISTALASCLKDENGTVDWDNLTDTVKALINSGGSGGGGGISFIPKVGDLAFDTSGSNTYLKQYEKTYGNGLGIKYDYPDTDITTFFNSTNTLYILRYSHDWSNSLDEETQLPITINIPANCKIDFKGGNLKGSIYFNNTELLGVVNLKGSTLDGIVINKVFDASWICNRDGVTDDAPNIRSIVKVSKNIEFPSGEYLLDTYTQDHWVNARIHLFAENSNTSIKGKSGCVFKIPALDSADPDRSVFDISYVGGPVKNIEISNITFDVNNTGYDKNETFHEHSHIINMLGATNISIHDCIVNDFYGDAIYIGARDETSPNRKQSENIHIYNNIISGPSHNNRNGISITGGKKIIIENNYFYEMTQLDTMPGIIDMEPNAGCEIQDVLIKNNYFTGSRVAIGVVLKYSGTDSRHKNITISDNIIADCVVGITVDLGSTANLKVLKLISNVIKEDTTPYSISGTIPSDFWVVINNIFEKPVSTSFVNSLTMQIDNKVITNNIEILTNN